MRELRATLAILTSVLVLGGCASNREVSQQVPAATSGEKSMPPASELPPSKPHSDLPSQPEELLPDSVVEIVDEAGRLFRQGEKRFWEGNLEEARVYFRESLPDPELTPLEELTDVDLFTIEVDPHLKELVSKDLLEARFDIPVVLNDYVLRVLNYYQTRGRLIMEQGLRRSRQYLTLLRKIFREEGVPPDLVYMAHVESLFKPYAYSRAHARGMWQFVRHTGLRYGLRQDWWVDERSDIVKSTRAAARYLGDLYDQFEDWHLALAAYNVGEQRIEKIIKRYRVRDYWTMVDRRFLPRETRQFVPSILAAVIIFRHPEFYGFQVEPEKELDFAVLSLDGQVDLRVVAELIDVPFAQLAELNPELRREMTPFNYPDYQLKVPSDKVDLLKEKLASLPPEKKVRFRHHTVRRGETLSMIADRYSSSVQAIAQLNRIGNVHRIREGKDLIIPLSASAYPSSRMDFSAARREGASSHIVRRGESLARIARMYAVTVRDLLRWNDLKSGHLIYPGQRIRVSAQASSKRGAERSNASAGQ